MNETGPADVYVAKNAYFHFTQPQSNSCSEGDKVKAEHSKCNALDYLVLSLVGLESSALGRISPYIRISYEKNLICMTVEQHPNEVSREEDTVKQLHLKVYFQLLAYIRN